MLAALQAAEHHAMTDLTLTRDEWRVVATALLDRAATLSRRAPINLTAAEIAECRRLHGLVHDYVEATWSPPSPATIAAMPPAIAAAVRQVVAERAADQGQRVPPGLAATCG